MQDWCTKERTLQLVESGVFVHADSFLCLFFGGGSKTREGELKSGDGGVIDGRAEIICANPMVGHRHVIVDRYEPLWRP
jgi:hypothetical protein